MPDENVTAKLASRSGELVKSLGPFDATMIVAGSMIGSGIFIVSADIARQVKSPGLLIIAWLVTGLMTMMAALCYAELAAAMPKAGGEYIFLRESFGSMWGFLYGWTMLLVIQTATIAAVAIAFANFTGVLFPRIPASAWIWKPGTFGPYKMWFGMLGPYSPGLNTQNLLAILSLVFLTWINTRGVRLGAKVQNIFTLAKIAALGGLILLGFAFGTRAVRADNLGHFWRNADFFGVHAYAAGQQTVWVHTLTLVGLAMVGALFSSSAWTNVTFTAAEVRNPSRNLPLSLVLGAGTVTLLYVLANFAYLQVLPLAGTATGGSTLERGIQFAAGDRVGTATAEAILGPAGAVVMAIAVIISTFGCNNGLILSGARVYYAMARDGLFFRQVSTVNRRNAPSAALWVQCVWACALCLSGTYRQLLDFVVFAVVMFYILTVAGLFVLRIRRPDMERPYRVFGYPVLPGVYLLLALFIEVQLLRYKPQYTWPGLMIVSSGIPIYLLWRARQRKADSLEGTRESAESNTGPA
ncbi:MAG TPA: amino acid permease [Terriglobales bacterium]|jgi:APA family basic amino acid/polyamine antiporter|nr:amino acid permease [Terriglobales bacterium]